MSFKQEDVEMFEQDFETVMKYLSLMMNNPIVSKQDYRDLSSRIRSFESLFIDISTSARSDKD